MCTTTTSSESLGCARKAYMLLSWQSIGGDGNFLHIYSGCSALAGMPLWIYYGRGHVPVEFDMLRWPFTSHVTFSPALLAAVCSLTTCELTWAEALIAMIALQAFGTGWGGRMPTL